jgi:hypothetical protein
MIAKPNITVTVAYPPFSLNFDLHARPTRVYKVELGQVYDKFVIYCCCVNIFALQIFLVRFLSLESAGIVEALIGLIGLIGLKSAIDKTP